MAAYYAVMPMIGSGTYADPWRPELPNPTIDWAGVQIDADWWMVCWPGGDPGGPIELPGMDCGSDIMNTPLNPGQRNRIENMFGITLAPGDTLVDAVWKVLEADIVPNADGMKELWAGGVLLHSTPA
jgi:hypothetical protein